MITLIFIMMNLFIPSQLLLHTFTNNIEQTEKQVNDFHFARSNSPIDSINQTDLSSIQYIAGLCPMAYGVAVFKARSELARLGIDTIVYDDKANCAQLGYFRQMLQQIKDSSSSNEFIVSPNPAHDRIQLTFAHNTAIGDIINILTTEGKLVVNYEIKTKTQIIDLNIEFLPSSLYFIEYIHNQNNSFAKFSLIK